MSNSMTSVENEEGLEHYGKKGMKWGVRKASRKSTSGDSDSGVRSIKSINKSYKENPTFKEAMLGKGKTLAEREKSRRVTGATAVGFILAGTAAKIAVNKIPSLAPYKAGVKESATVLQLAGAVSSVAATALGNIDRSIEKRK